MIFVAKKYVTIAAFNTSMLWCTGEAGKVVVPVVKGRHVIPTGNQIPNTPLLAMAAPRPSTEPAGTGGILMDGWTIKDGVGFA